MKYFMKLVALLFLVTLVAGCSSKGGVDESEESEASQGAKGGGSKSSKYGKYGSNRYGGSAGGGRYGSGIRPGDVGPTEGILGQRVIYFSYDSDDVLPEYQGVVNSHAEYLSSHPDAKLVLEGHADERGSSEYNVALGERRALSVARTMRLQGAGDSQVRAMSYGEEKPATSGHDEDSWQQNRRVELYYPGN